MPHSDQWRKDFSSSQSSQETQKEKRKIAKLVRKSIGIDQFVPVEVCSFPSYIFHTVTDGHFLQFPYTNDYK